MEHQVTFHIDTEKLPSYHDGYLASLWHIAQANPAPHGDRHAGELAEAIGREIIKRWLQAAGVPLWEHQGGDHYHKALIEHCLWDGNAWGLPEQAADVEPATTGGL